MDKENFKENFKFEKSREFLEKSRMWKCKEIDAKDLDLQPELLFQSSEANLCQPYNIRQLKLETFFQGLTNRQIKELETQVEAGFGETKEGLIKLNFIIKDLIGDIAAEEPFLEGLYGKKNYPIKWDLNYDKEISTYFLEKYSNNSEFFRKIYKTIGSPKLDEVSRRRVEERLTEMRITREKMKNIRSEISRKRERIAPTPTKDTVSVWVNGVSVAGDGSEKRYIETLWAQSCVAVSIWDPETKTGGLAHLPPWTDAKSAIDMIVGKIKRIQDNQDISRWQPEARIVGGWQYYSEKIILDILDGLSNHNIRVVEKDILNPKHALKDIVLDTKTGELFDIDRGKAEIREEDFEEFQRSGDFWSIMRDIDEYQSLERDAKNGESQPTYDFDPRGL